MDRRIAFLGLCAALATVFGAGARAQVPAAPGVLSAENLLTPLPTGWKIAHSQSQKGVILQEMIPNGQTVEAWQEMITVWIYRGQTQAPLAASFDHIERLYTGGCQTPPVIGKREELTERGYPIGVQLIGCDRTKGGNIIEAMIYKTIKGKDATYQVQRAWRLTPAQARDGATTKLRVEAASAYLRTVSVCDTRDAQNPCPTLTTKP